MVPKVPFSGFPCHVGHQEEVAPCFFYIFSGGGTKLETITSFFFQVLCRAANWCGALLGGFMRPLSCCLRNVRTKYEGKIKPSRFGVHKQTMAIMFLLRVAVQGKCTPTNEFSPRRLPLQFCWGEKTLNRLLWRFCGEKSYARLARKFSKSGHQTKLVEIIIERNNANQVYWIRLRFFGRG